MDKEGSKRAFCTPPHRSFLIVAKSGGSNLDRKLPLFSTFEIQWGFKNCKNVKRKGANMWILPCGNLFIYQARV